MLAQGVNALVIQSPPTITPQFDYIHVYFTCHSLKFTTLFAASDKKTRRINTGEFTGSSGSQLV